MRALFSFFAVLVLVSLVAGCGQKGPLYRASPEATQAPAADSATGAADQEDAETR